MIKVDWKPGAKQLREFGLFALVGFPAIAGMLLWLQDIDLSIVYGLCGLGLVCGILGFAAPATLRPLYVVMMLIALPIGFVISHVLLATIFFLLVTPLGLIFRLFGKDPLPKRPDPNLKSYWTVREKPRAPASYLRLY